MLRFSLFLLLLFFRLNADAQDSTTIQLSLHIPEPGVLPTQGLELAFHLFDGKESIINAQLDGNGKLKKNFRVSADCEGFYVEVVTRNRGWLE